MLSRVLRLAILVLLLVVGLAAAATTNGPADDSGLGSSNLAASALLAVDQNRATIVERIVNEWGDRLTATPGGVSKAQLKEMLSAMRADQLLAASLAGSLDGLKAIVVAAPPGTGKVRIADAGGIVPSALGDPNGDLVYTPVTPCRLFDTRPGQGGNGTPTPGVVRTYGAITPVAQQGGPGGCAAAPGAAVALIQIGTLTPSGNGLLQAGPQGATSFPNALILYQPGDQYGATVAMPLNPANGQFDLLEQFAAADLYGDLLGYFKPAVGAFVQGGNSLGTTAKLGTNDNNALELYANGARVMRYEPNATSPNVIGGHSNNSASASFYGQTVAGGGSAGNDCYEPTTGTSSRSCNNQASAQHATIGGGQANRASVAATVGGGYANTASGVGSTVGGGVLNSASASYSTVPGGHSNVASGDRSFAAGNRAKAREAGSFVWADSRDADFDPSSFRGIAQSVDTFNVRATGVGGVFFVTGINATTGAPSWGCYAQNGGGWTCTSDRNAKRNLAAVDSRDVLEKVTALPLYRWQPKEGPHVNDLHIGPMAQDFHAAFGLGHDDKAIGSQDADGVALAAIQGLNAKLEAKVAEQAREIAQLRRAVEVLMARTSPEGKVARSQ